MTDHIAANFDFEELEVNPDRFCEGVSKIGYQPSAAIMDIVDNSVAAGATRIEIELVLREDATLNSAGSVMLFRITDNGSGMTDSQINTALQLGSDVKYSANSLSKFGFGLKSAGFSLGRRIQVYSKHAGELSSLKFVDRDIIRDRKQYGVCTQPLTDDMTAYFSTAYSGTVVEISNPAPRQDSAAKIKKELLQRLGVTYFNFLSRANDAIKITLKVRDKIESVEAIDMLFWSEAIECFDPDTYDGKRPCKVYDEFLENPVDPEGEKIRLQMAIFPMEKMRGYAGFNEDERAQIKKFNIFRENSGFFFYRNGRLIRWGDKIAGATRDDIGFRAKVSFTTNHDELFHVDVSKQNLSIPEEVLQNFQLQARIPLGLSREAFKLCGALFAQGEGPEGAEFNKRTETFEETDAAENIAPPPPEEKRKRRERLDAKTKEAEVEAGEVTQQNEPVVNPPEQLAVFQRVRYSDAISGISVAVPGFDKDNGTYVRVNKNHSYYQLVLASLPAADPMRQSIEAILFAASVAEIKTMQNLADVDSAQIEKVFNRFRSVLSQNLDAWVSNNQDLFG